MKKLTTFLLLTILATTSCSGDKKIEGERVSLLKKAQEITIDQDLQNSQIAIPAPPNSTIWFDNNVEAQKIQNYPLKSDFDKKKRVKLATKIQNPENPASKPLVVDGVIYILDSKSYLTARLADNPKEILWKSRVNYKKAGHKPRGGKISYYDNQIFVTSGYNELSAFNASTGEQIWRKKINSMPISKISAYGNAAFVITNDNKLYALDQKNGAILWIHSAISKNTAIKGSADPVIHQNLVIASYSSGEIYALKRQTGQVKWSANFASEKNRSFDLLLNDIDATPIAQDGKVYAISNDGLMMALSLKDGEPIWQNKNLTSIIDFWLAGDFIYLIDNQARLAAINAQNGSVKWTKQLQKYRKKKKKSGKILIYGGLVMADGKILVTRSDKKLLFISPADGNILKIKKIPGKIDQNFAIADQKLYLHLRNKFSDNLLVW